MNSIKELKEQLGYEEIGLDDIFVFHCTQCGKCEYSCAMKSHFRKFGNQMSGSGNHLCNYASLLA